MEPPGRLFQDENFEVVQLAGRVAERVGYLRIGQSPEPDGHILYLLPVGGSWNRAFLDAWFAVWEDWGDVGPVPPEHLEDEAVQFVDCSHEFGSRVIRRAVARAEVDRMPRLQVEFEDGGRIELRVNDETDWESASVIVIHATA